MSDQGDTGRATHAGDHAWYSTIVESRLS